MRPGATGYSPRRMWTSVPQMVVIVTRTMASVGPQEGTGRSCRVMTPGRSKTAARMESVPGRVLTGPETGAAVMAHLARGGLVPRRYGPMRSPASAFGGGPAAEDYGVARPVSAPASRAASASPFRGRTSTGQAAADEPSRDAVEQHGAQRPVAARAGEKDVGAKRAGGEDLHRIPDDHLGGDALPALDGGELAVERGAGLA